MKNYSSVALAILLLLVVALPAEAHHQKRVLGDTATVASLPPTVEGPGTLLPDHPLYFLDGFKQQTRLFLALSPENRAKLHKDIAGERLAELRIMLVKQDEKGIATALTALATEYKAAAKQIQQAHLAGRDVSKTAKLINDDMQAKLEILDMLEAQAADTLAAKVRVAESELFTAKVDVEDALTEDDLNKAIQQDLERKAHKEVEGATSSVENLQESIEALQEQAKEAAAQSQKQREAALRKAIEEKNEALKKAQEEALEVEKKAREEELRLQEDLMLQTKKTIEAAKATAEKYEATKAKKATSKSTTSEEKS